MFTRTVQSPSRRGWDGVKMSAAAWKRRRRREIQSSALSVSTYMSYRDDGGFIGLAVRGRIAVRSLSLSVGLVRIFWTVSTIVSFARLNSTTGGEWGSLREEVRSGTP